MPLRVGWIGTGLMGKPMAENCIKFGQHQLFVHNRTKSKCSSLLEMGAQYCETPESIIQNGVNVIVSLVGYPSETEQVIFGERGILDGLKKLTNDTCPPVFIDMSTNEVDLTHRIANTLKHYGVLCLDAPVTGGDIGAKNRSLTIFVGGQQHIFNELKNNLFNCMSDTTLSDQILYMGETGKGQQAKISNQIAVAANIIGVCEALLFAKKAGLDLEKVVKGISKGAGSSWALCNLGPKIINEDYTPGFYVEHFIKDMTLALKETQRMNLCLPGLGLVSQLFNILSSHGMNKQGIQGLIFALEKMNNCN